MKNLHRLCLGVPCAVFAAASLVPVLAQTPPSRATPAPPALWTVTADIASPESAFYDAASNSVFVSNINGGVTDKDGNGYISRLTPEGTCRQREVGDRPQRTERAPERRRNPVGGRHRRGRRHRDRQRAHHVAREDRRRDVPQRSGDRARRHHLRVRLHEGPRIYAVKDGKASIFVEGEDAIETPNGVLVDGNRVIVGSMGLGVFGPPGGRGRGAGAPAGGRLFAFDRTTKVRTVITPQPVGGIDGIELDGSGGYLVTDVFGSRLLQVSASGTARTLLQFPGRGRGLRLHRRTSNRHRAVPERNSVSAYDLTAALAAR